MADNPATSATHSSSPRPLAADDALPAVEPPSAGFIIQLFVVPGVIVAAIVAVWLAVTWLAQKGDDPARHFQALQQPGPGRWQSAMNLTMALQGKRHEAFKRDVKAAADLAAMLDKEIDAAAEIEDKDAREQSITLRQYLAKALGEFYVDAGIDVLLRAATTQRTGDEAHVRRFAIQSIALLAANIAENNPGQRLQHPQLAETLLTLSEDDAPTIRYETAYALGTVGGSDLLLRLQELLRDGNADVRYNAALGLARHGDPQVVPVLEEMLDPAQLDAALELELLEDGRPFKRALIMNNAMRATRLLAEKHPQVDIGALLAAIERLTTSGVDAHIPIAAKTHLHEIRDIQAERAAK